MHHTLGVAVKILGNGGLRARDGRRADHAPHLSVSLLLVREVLLYLAAQRIQLYRLAHDLAPYAGDARFPSMEQQINACADMLAETGTLARAHGLRLTMHLPLWLALASPDEALAARSAAAIVAQARLLAALGCGPEGVLVMHIGGAHDQRPGTLQRWARRFAAMPAWVRERIAVEPDDDAYTLADLLWLHEATGVPIVFDVLHHQLNNPARLPLGVGLALALATWPAGVRPKVHFSSQRTEAHVLPARRGAPQQILAPQLGQHADFINPLEFAEFVRAARGLPGFDIMLEAKGADVALVRLRADVQRIAPELVGMVQ